VNYDIRVIQVKVVPHGEPIFDRRTTTVEIVDEAAGEFLTVSQDDSDHDTGALRVDSEEWPTIQKAINKMRKEIKKYDREV